MQKIFFTLCCAGLLAFSLSAAAAPESLFTRLTQQSHIWERQQALDEMQATDTASKKILASQLKDALKEKNPYVRQNAAEALGALDGYASDSVDDLRQAEKDPVPEVRMAASVSLARLGHQDPEFTERLIAQLATQPGASNRLGNVTAKLSRYEAANALGFIASGPNHVNLAAAVAPLSQAVVSDPDIDVRNRAAWALGAMGSQARSAVPALQTAQRDPAGRDVASWALDNIQQ